MGLTDRTLIAQRHDDSVLFSVGDLRGLVIARRGHAERPSSRASRACSRAAMCYEPCRTCAGLSRPLMSIAAYGWAGTADGWALSPLPGPSSGMSRSVLAWVVLALMILALVAAVLGSALVSKRRAPVFVPGDAVLAHALVQEQECKGGRP